MTVLTVATPAVPIPAKSAFVGLTLADWVSMKLWIDDLRTAPEGWEWAITSEHAINMLRLMGSHCNEISFDHDLGGDDTVRPVIIWLCENDNWPAIVKVHSANTVGVEWIEGMVKRYAPPGTLRYW